MATEVPAAILAAGGRGDRFGASTPKQFCFLGGRRLLEWSLPPLLEACDPVVVVVPEARVEAMEAIAGRYGGVEVGVGGDTRQRSVANGLAMIEASTVVIHDAARPFIDVDLVRRVIAALDLADGAIAAVPVDETLKRVDLGAGDPVQSDVYAVLGTVDRSDLWQAQTPQAFRTDVLSDAHRRCASEGFAGTDDAQLIERCGGRVSVVRGSRTNLKITYSEDLDLAERLLRMRS